jgi:hypothetical protein
MTNIKRIPRPMGLTLMAAQYHKAQTTDDQKQLKHELQEYIIRTYLNQGFRLNNQPTTLENLATYTQLTKKEILYKLSHYKGDWLDITNKEEMEKGAAFSLMTLMQETLDNQALLKENLQSLMIAKNKIIKKSKKGKLIEIGEQGNSRNPAALMAMASNKKFEALASRGYIEGLQPDIHKALDLLLQQGKATERLTRLFADLATPKGTKLTTSINIQANQNTNQIGSQNNYLTVEKAFMVLAEAKGNQVLGPDDKKVLAQEYLNEVPNVNAKNQSGYKIPTTGTRTKAPNPLHENRREDEVGEILE